MFFFFNDTATTEIYTLSLHDALPILYADPRKTPAEITAPPTFSSGAHRTVHEGASGLGLYRFATSFSAVQTAGSSACSRSEEHTSELQSRQYLVCRLLLEKKKHSTHP